MTNYQVYTVDAFTKTIGQGNRAGVVFLDEALDDKTMQSLANRLNYPETAFVLKSDTSLYQYEIRYFTPLIEVPLCGHATIAAFYTLAKINKLSPQSIKFKTKAGILEADITYKNGDYLIAMCQNNILVDEPLDNLTINKILEALKLDPKYIAYHLPIASAACGNPKIMLPITSYDVLLDLMPDFNTLKQISSDTNTTGYYLFYLDGNHVYGRMFAPSSGNNEDITTGVANAALAAYLVKYANFNDDFTLNVIQGNKTRKGNMQVSVSFVDNVIHKIKVIGTAIIDN